MYLLVIALFLSSFTGKVSACLSRPHVPPQNVTGTSATDSPAGNLSTISSVITSTNGAATTHSSANASASGATESTNTGSRHTPVTQQNATVSTRTTALSSSSTSGMPTSVTGTSHSNMSSSGATDQLTSTSTPNTAGNIRTFTDGNDTYLELGCFDRESTNLTINYKLLLGDQISPRKCAKLCREITESPGNFIGVGFHECRCMTSFGALKKLGDSSCDHLCPGDGSSMCGNILGLNWNIYERKH